VNRGSLIAAIVATLVVAQTAVAQSGKIVISQAAYRAYQEYLAAFPKGGMGGFIISQDGKRWGSFICQAGKPCDLTAMINKMSAQCVTETQTCNPLAFNDKPATPFDVEK